jgi:hypothetical protein
MAKAQNFFAACPFSIVQDAVREGQFKGASLAADEHWSTKLLSFGVVSNMQAKGVHPGFQSQRAGITSSQFGRYSWMTAAK